MKRLLALAAFLGLLTAQPVRASAIADWTWDDPAQTVGPFDTLTMQATLHNDVSSTEHLLGSDIFGAAFTFGTLSGPYDFEFALTLFTQFAGIDLAPGDSFSFVFGTLTPIAPPIPAGVYSSPGADIAFLSDFGTLQTGQFQVTVAEAVPEPATMALFGTGLLGLTVRRRRSA